MLLALLVGHLRSRIDTYGGKVVFIGRFIAVLRTYAAFLAGTNRMSGPRFLVFNAAGGITYRVGKPNRLRALAKNDRTFGSEVTPRDPALACLAVSQSIHRALDGSGNLDRG